MVSNNIIKIHPIHMPYLKTTLSTFLTLAMLATNFAPMANAYAAEQHADVFVFEKQEQQEAVRFTDILPFPEDTNRPPIDWSSIDWDKEIILEKDREAYYKQVEELERSGKFDEVEKLQMKKTLLRNSSILT
jgi:hypothetical protein